MLLTVITVLVSAWPAAESAAAQPSETCQRWCGDVHIPYPFGIGRGCYLFTGEGDVTFGLTCNLTAAGNYKPFCGEAEVLGISLRRGQARIHTYINSWCYNDTSRSMDEQIINGWDFTDSWFQVADEDNKFTVVGCNSLAYVSSAVNETEYMTGCMATCPSVERLENGSCAGMGCCQAAIPRGANSFGSSFEDKFNTSEIAGFSRCSYAVLVEAAAFDFRTTYVTTGDFMESTGGKVPLVFDWVVGKETCRKAKQNATAYMCVSSNSECVDSRNGPGYLCNCSKGYEGNPYLPDGCQDIDECLYPKFCEGKGTCHNIIGDFICCPDSTKYDPGKMQCTSTKHKHLIIGVTLGLSAGFGMLFVSLSGIFLFNRWKSGIKRRQRRKYFQENQGLLLEQLILSNENASSTTKIFSLEEMEKATNNFDETRILGRGGHGMVYKGILSDQRVVAIKKSKFIEKCEIKQFINEVAILSQINHRNIVRLFGCCLETEVPLLVYDFVSNGSLFQILHHNASNGFSISWDDCLRIATEAAGALYYLHSAASVSVFHRDVKSSNILLDENYTAKVSDFGASRLVPIDQTHIVTNVQGTFGYLDPEYYHTGQLNDKSDVYSFGVVLIELLLRKEPIFTSESGLKQNLSNYFVQEVKVRPITEIVDPQVLEEATEEEINSVACLAEVCLKLQGEERPTMKQAEMTLQSLREKRFKECQVIGGNDEENQALLTTRAIYQSLGVELGSGARATSASQHSGNRYSMQQEFISSASLPH